MRHQTETRAVPVKHLSATHCIFASAIGKAGYRVSQGKDLSAWCLWRTCFNPTALARLPEPDW